jgi:hypothetical protein
MEDFMDVNNARKVLELVENGKMGLNRLTPKSHPLLLQPGITGISGCPEVRREDRVHPQDAPGHH